MRLALPALAVLTLALPAAAMAAPATPVVCSGQAQASRGEAVTVLVQVEPDGRRSSVQANWNPPQLGVTGKSLDQPDLTLSLSYDRASASGIGPMTGASALVFVMAPPRDRVPSAKLQARLAPLSGELRLDGGAPSRFSLKAPDAGLEELPGTAVRTADLSLPASLPAETELRLVDRSGKIAAQMRFATGASESRDALFAQAWREAEAATADLASCEAAATGQD